MCKRDNEPGHNTWPCLCLFYKRFWQLHINTHACVCVCSRFNLTCKQFAATININKIWNYVEIQRIYMEIAYASILFVHSFCFDCCVCRRKNTHSHTQTHTKQTDSSAIIFKLFIVLLAFYANSAKNIFEWNLNVQFVFDLCFWLGKFVSVLV